MERDFKGVWIPKELYLNKSLSWSEKILLVEIDSLTDESKGCFASNKYLGEFLGISEGSCANMISKLKKMELIEYVFFDGRNRGIKLHKNMKAAFTKLLKASQKNEGKLHKNIKEASQKNEHNNIESNKENKDIGVSVSAANSLFENQETQQPKPTKQTKQTRFPTFEDIDGTPKPENVNDGVFYALRGIAKDRIQRVKGDKQLTYGAWDIMVRTCTKASEKYTAYQLVTHIEKGYGRWLSPFFTGWEKEVEKIPIGDSEKEQAQNPFETTTYKLMPHEVELVDKANEWLLANVSEKHKIKTNDAARLFRSYEYFTMPRRILEHICNNAKKVLPDKMFELGAQFGEARKKFVNAQFDNFGTM